MLDRCCVPGFVAAVAAFLKDDFLDLVIVNHEMGDLALVADVDPQRFGLSIESVDQRLATAEEERVGPRHRQRAGQGRLEANPLVNHPRQTALALPDRLARQNLVGLALGDLDQVVEILVFEVAIGQGRNRRLMHATEVAGVAGIAPAPGLGRALQQQH